MIYQFLFITLVGPDDNSNFISQDVLENANETVFRISKYIESTTHLKWLLRRGLFPLLIGGYPVAVASDFITSTTMLIGGFAAWIILWATHHTLVAFRNRAETDNFVSGIENLNGSFAGCIEDIAFKISKGNKLSEQECKRSCISLLHRIRDALDVITESTSDVSIRATLAVPFMNEDESLKYLRVWCYDEPHADRQWSILKPDWPGAPKAFETNKIQAVKDLQTSDLLKEADGISVTDRRFRSVVSIPVARSRSTGKPIAVVNLDATEPDYFNIENFLQQVIPVVLPIVHMIGLAILAKDASDSYSFG